mmetsp:Transcript_39342/g.111479  ORF Transcript_39342/g.111479 Transcript_39342/m.111479 type:complete len:245 (-) Transcript_39342:230-964(-)
MSSQGDFRAWPARRSSSSSSCTTSTHGLGQGTCSGQPTGPARVQIAPSPGPFGGTDGQPPPAAKVLAACESHRHEPLAREGSDPVHRPCCSPRQGELGGVKGSSGVLAAGVWAIPADSATSEALAPQHLMWAHFLPALYSVTVRGGRHWETTSHSSPDPIGACLHPLLTLQVSPVVGIFPGRYGIPDPVPERLFRGVQLAMHRVGSPRGPPGRVSRRSWPPSLWSITLRGVWCSLASYKPVWSP